MAQEQALQFLQQGIAASRSGNPDQARELFQQAVRLDPQNETIWLWLASVARDDKERFFCLKQLLTINPQNEFALKGMQALGVKAAPETVQAAPSTSVPVLSDEKYSRLQQMLDDFLRHYSPQPVDRLMIQWGHKPKGRYSEGGGKRLQRTFYVAAALVTLVVVAGIALIAVGAGSMLGGESTKVAVHSTRAATSTATPTLTPTLGGASPTPFPNPMAIPPTEIPSGLTQGSVYEAAEPTAIYPPVDPSVAGAISDAVDDYSIGEYAQAAEALETERKSSRPQCYAAVVYYEAMSYAGLGGAQNLNKASQVLEEDLAYQPSDPRYSSCQNAPLVLAGLGYVRYLQNRIDEALTLSQRALADDPKLVEASITKARIELQSGDSVSAQRTVEQQLANWPEDTNLLLLAAEIGLANSQPNDALKYVGRALYIDPVLQPALQIQAQTYISLADQEIDPERRLELYGLGVIGAQTLLLYYPGDPAGYYYLAKARIGEGNNSLAEVALNRILAVESSLPDSADSIVLDAYRMRGNLYYQEGYFREAESDFNEVVLRDSSDFDTLGKLVEVAFAEEEYSYAVDRLNELLAVDPTNPNYLLQEAKALVEICTFYPDKLSCEYGDMLDLLSDAFIAGLGNEPQAAEAYSYRAQARYWKTFRQGDSLSDEERQAAYQQVLGDVNQALAVRDSAVDHYYRGLVSEALGMSDQALEEYQWVAYWSTWYSYPFKNRDFDTRLANLIAGQPTATPEATQPGGTVRPTATPSPQPTRPALPEMP